MIPTMKNFSQAAWFKDQTGTWNKNCKVPVTELLTSRGIGFSFNFMDAESVYWIDQWVNLPFAFHKLTKACFQSFRWFHSAETIFSQWRTARLWIEPPMERFKWKRFVRARNNESQCNQHKPPPSFFPARPTRATVVADQRRSHWVRRRKNVRNFGDAESSHEWSGHDRLRDRRPLLLFRRRATTEVFQALLRQELSKRVHFQRYCSKMWLCTVRLHPRPGNANLRASRLSLRAGAEIPN